MLASVRDHECSVLDFKEEILTKAALFSCFKEIGIRLSSMFHPELLEQPWTKIRIEVYNK